MYALDENYDQPLAEHWNGSTWSLQTVALPPGAPGATLNDVACTSPTACVAIGSVNGTPGTATALAERWNGTTWSPQTFSTPRTTGFRALSCPSATACTSVGVSTSPSGRTTPVAATWDGTTWTVQRLPEPPHHGNNDDLGVEFPSTALTGVACTAATACVAVGSTQVRSHGTPVTVPLAEHYR